MRVIVTGSRGWTDRERIRERLARLPVGTVVVHGSCPKGADRITDEEARKLMLVRETHPADWDGFTPEDEERFGRKGAGRKRNEEMASLGADLCIAFWDARSPGTRDMIRRANQHGISVQIITPEGTRLDKLATGLGG